MKIAVRVIVFFGLALALTMLLGGLQEAAGISYSLVTLPQWGPGLAALLMLLLFRRDGLRLSLGLRGVRPVLLLGALLAPAAVGVVLFILLRPAAAALPAPWWAMLPGMALGALGEELGWRGYLHKRVDPHLRPLLSSALVGVLWALWHVGLYQNGPVYMLFVVILMIAYSLVLYALIARTGFNVWVAALFHLGINVANLPFYGLINEPRFMIANALVWVVVAAVVVVVRRDLFLGPVSSPPAATRNA